jgi:hypothetical protein
MIHVLTNEWKLPNFPDAIINSMNLYSIIKFRKMKHTYVDIDKISYKPLETINQKETRYIEVDPDYPCIVATRMHNPHNKTYRLIDGRHRLLKTVNNKQYVLKCFILDFDDVKKFLEYV